MENMIVKTLIYDKQVRLFFIDNTKLIDEILKLNNEANKMLKNALGKTISVMSLISGTLKGDQRLSLQITMSDPKYKVFADCDASGNVRGYLNEELLNAPHDEMDQNSLQRLIGKKGTIRVIKGTAMNQFTGITEMPCQNIADDFSHYFNQSEQTSTFIGANIEFDDGNSVLFSNGVYAQLLPDGAPELIDEVKHTFRHNREFFLRLNQFSETDIEEKLRELFKDVQVVGCSPVQFYCGCSKEMFYGMLQSLSKAELLDAIEKKEVIEAACQICGRTYQFYSNDMEGLLNLKGH